MKLVMNITIHHQYLAGPKGPTDLAISDEGISSSGFTVSFQGNSNNYDVFTIQICLDNATDCKSETNTTDTQYVAHNLTTGTKYNVIVNTMLYNGLKSSQPRSISSFTRKLATFR